MTWGSALIGLPADATATGPRKPRKAGRLTVAPGIALPDVTTALAGLPPVRERGGLEYRTYGLTEAERTAKQAGAGRPLGPVDQIARFVGGNLYPETWGEALTALRGAISTDPEKQAGGVASGGLGAEIAASLTVYPGAVQAMRDVATDFRADRVGPLTVLAALAALPIVGFIPKLLRTAKLNRFQRAALETMERGPDYINGLKNATANASGPQRVLFDPNVDDRRFIEHLATIGSAWEDGNVNLLTQELENVARSVGAEKGAVETALASLPQAGDQPTVLSTFGRGPFAPGREVTRAEVEQRLGRRLNVDRRQAFDAILEAHRTSGGSTVNLRTGKPITEGFAVSPYKDRERVLREAPSAQDLRIFAAENGDLLDQPGHTIGTWFDESSDRHVLDVVNVVGDRDEALRIGRGAEQNSIYDLAKRETVSLLAPGAIIRGTAGQSHADILPENFPWEQLEDGFVTRDGRFVTRQEGAGIVYGDVRPQDQLEAGDLLDSRQPRKHEIVGPAFRVRDVAAPAAVAAGAGPAASDEEDRGGTALAASLIGLPPRARKLLSSLLEDEARLLATGRGAARSIAQFARGAEKLPETEVLAAGAQAGAGGRDFYRNSSRALVETFGPDAPRFAALLAAMSPQTPIEANLASALDMWDLWTRAGRPTDARAIKRILNANARAVPGGGELPSRIPNAIRALTAEDPVRVVLSGPKVSNFHRNLLGETERVTLDTWQSQLAAIDPRHLSRKLTTRGEQIEVPSGIYLAYVGRHREVADYLTKTTGRKWTPDEVQAALWTWGKSLGEIEGGIAPARGAEAKAWVRGIAAGKIQPAFPTPPQMADVPNFAELLGVETPSPPRFQLRSTADTRYFPDRPTKIFDIISPEGTRVGFVGGRRRGDALVDVRMGGGPGNLGVKGVREVFRLLSEQFPGIESIRGDRVSGVNPNRRLSFPVMPASGPDPQALSILAQNVARSKLGDYALGLGAGAGLGLLAPERAEAQTAPAPQQGNVQIVTDPKTGQPQIVVHLHMPENAFGGGGEREVIITDASGNVLRRGVSRLRKRNGNRP